MQIAEVYWRDSRLFMTQHDKNEKLEVCVIRSVGLVVEHTKDRLVIAGDLVDDDYRRTLVIPEENIVNLYLYGKKQLKNKRRG